MLHTIVEHFETLASEMEQAIHALADHEDVEHMIARLGRAKRAAEKGAALARARLEEI